MKSTNSIIIVLALSDSISVLVERATSVHDAMATNAATFPTPPLTMTQFSADIAALVTSQTAAKTRAAGAVATRDEKQQVVVADLHQLKAYVQQIASATPAHADVIAQAAAMTLRKPGAQAKSDLAVKQKVSGSVQVIAKVQKGDRSHEWQYSLDGKTWTNATPSLQGKTTITGLQTGVMTYFRQRAITKTGPGDWSQAISALVA